MASIKLPAPQKPPKPLKLSSRIPKAPKWAIPLYARAPAKGIRSTVPKATTTPTVSPTTSAAGAPAATSGPTSANPFVNNPYAGLPDWAQNQLRQIDADQKSHQAYAGQVGNWLSQALTNLTGVNPSSPVISSTLQNQYLSNVAGPVSAAYNAAAAGAGGPQVMATAPGGIAASPTAFLSSAASAASAARGPLAMQQAQVNANLATLQSNTQAQAYVKTFADMQAGLPAIYSQKRLAAENAIDQYIAQAQADAAKQAEALRHNRVTEAISAQNAQTQATLGLSNLGLRAGTAAARTAATQVAQTTPAPPGYVRDPATGKVYRDPSVPQASSSSSGGGGAPSSSSQKYSKQWMSEHNFVGGWPKKPAKLPSWAKSGFTQGTDGRWYVKRGGSTSSGGLTAAPYTPRSVTTLQSSLGGYWKSGRSNGVEARFTGDPAGAGKWLIQWVHDNLKDFYRPKTKKVDVTKVKSVLSMIGGRPAAEALVLLGGHLNNDGTWK